MVRVILMFMKTCIFFRVGKKNINHQHHSFTSGVTLWSVVHFANPNLLIDQDLMTRDDRSLLSDIQMNILGYLTQLLNITIFHGKTHELSIYFDGHTWILFC